MGTRGYYGFYYDGFYYTVYNNYDSYPASLGVIILKEIIDALSADNLILEKWKDRLAIIDSTDSNKELVESTKNENYLENLLNKNYVIDNKFDEQYSYIINLDADTFEYWTYGALALSVELSSERLSKLHDVFKLSL